MSERTDKMPRGQWMATEGRQLYHGWLVDLIERHREQPTDMFDTFAKPGREHARINLMGFANELASRLMDAEKNTPVDQRTLFRSKDDLLHYSSAEEFVGESNTANGILTHAGDGIEFACLMTAGLAMEASKALGVEEENDPAYFEFISAIMQTPSFHSPIEDMSTTGFAVLKNAFTSAMVHEKAADEISAYLGIQPLDSPMVCAKFDDGRPEFYLHPVLKNHLVSHLRLQNQKGEMDTMYRSHIMLARIKEGSFTSGCPVRKAPTGEEKSAIALLSDYMGERISDVMTNKRRIQQVGACVVADTFNKV
jgi:hypothetical protein